MRDHFITESTLRGVLEQHPLLTGLPDVVGCSIAGGTCSLLTLGATEPVDRHVLGGWSCERFSLLVFIVVINHARLHDTFRTAAAFHQLPTTLPHEAIKASVLQRLEFMLAYDVFDFGD
jgi:hypothetical protein